MKTAVPRRRESPTPTHAPAASAQLLLASAVGLAMTPVAWTQTPAPAAPSAPTEMTPVGLPVVLEAGPHHRLMQQVWRFINFKGEEQLASNSFVELASGLCPALTRPPANLWPPRPSSK